MNELRQDVFDFAHGRCEWPGCSAVAVELAHITSKGMGGSQHRDTVENVFAACFNHARVSDGLPPLCGGKAARDREYRRVPGVVEPPDGVWRTRDVLETFRDWLLTRRTKRRQV